MKIKFHYVLIIFLISSMLFCSCLSDIKNKKITEKYQSINNQQFFLHNDAVQNKTMININEKINKNNKKLQDIKNNKNVIQNNIKEIEENNKKLKKELDQLILIAENKA